MPNKRSRRNKIQNFYCPYCQKKMWRVGSSKHYLFYQGRAEIQKGFKLTSKKASFLANQQLTCVDTNVWLEEFFCDKDGQVWMHLSQNEEKTLVTRLANSDDWQRATKTIDPERQNPSVSEFTLRMSRNPSKTLNASKFHQVDYNATHKQVFSKFVQA